MFAQLNGWVEPMEVTTTTPLRATEDFIAPLTDRLAITSVPNATSDERLPEDLLRSIAQIATLGFPVVADCYLRVRLARSDVERFVALLDAIECLVRLSAVTIIASRSAFEVHDPDPANLLKTKGLGLGTWVGCLKALVRPLLKKVGDTPEELKFTEFWGTGQCETQKQLGEKVKKWGVLGPKGPTQLDWLQWMTDVRNATKGHGALIESEVRDLWHCFHEIFLFMNLRLKDLTLSSQLAILLSNDVTILSGWRRGVLQPKSDAQPTQVHELLQVELRLPKKTVLLGRYILVRDRQVFIWDGLTKDSKYLYLDYSSGERITATADQK
jgi:hypothetical protein